MCNLKSENTYLERGGQLRDIFASIVGLKVENGTSLLKEMELFITHPQSSGIESEVTQVIDPLNCSPAGQHFGICNCSLTEKQNTVRRQTSSIIISFKPLNIFKKLEVRNQNTKPYVDLCNTDKYLQRVSWCYTVLRYNEHPGSVQEMLTNRIKDVLYDWTLDDVLLYSLLLCWQVHCIYLLFIVYLMTLPVTPHNIVLL